ncbi:MAG: cytochrome P450 [Candidatus Binatia bacterium]|nr:cytochrome P450 [Candidatus Binatia bacterium]
MQTAPKEEPHEVAALKLPPRLSGGWPLVGHLQALRRAPIDLFWRVRNECGDVGEIKLATSEVVLLTGEDAQEAYFRAPEEQLDQAAAYPFMTPVFGEGVVFDGTTEQRREAMQAQSLRDKMMRGHAETIASEVRLMEARLGDSGEIDLLDFFAELTLYTSSACLIGKSFREELSAQYVPIFYDLERGTDPLAYVNPYLPISAFRKRDRARKKLVGMIADIFERRGKVPKEERELFDILLSLKHEDGSPRYTIDMLTGMFISTMFAGHHTTSGTTAWTLIELLRHRDYGGRAIEEVDALHAQGEDITYQALREIPVLENAIKEALRLHPPLIILMRKVMSDFEHSGYRIPAGKIVAASPAVSNRMPEKFPEPNRYDPDRYAEGRAEDRQPFAWIPFGAGRHRCIGAAFAQMQIKAILGILLHDYEWELSQPHDSYQDDHSKMVVQLRQPCRAKYRRREAQR